MKIIMLIGFLLAVLNFGPCGNDQPADMPQTEDSPAQTTPASFSAETLSDDFFVEVYEYQERIKISQQDKALRQAFCERGYLPRYQVFVSMGIGSLINPQSGQAIPRYMAERAATLDARRWASYAETWLNNNYQPDFGQLETFFNRQTEVVNRSVVGDSLFVFIATYFKKR